MKSLTEAQLHEMLTKAWEEGGATYIYNHGKGDGGWPQQPEEYIVIQRRVFFQKLIDEV